MVSGTYCLESLVSFSAMSMWTMKNYHAYIALDKVVATLIEMT